MDRSVRHNYCTPAVFSRTSMIREPSLTDLQETSHISLFKSHGQNQVRKWSKGIERPSTYHSVWKLGCDLKVLYIGMLKTMALALALALAVVVAKTVMSFPDEKEVGTLNVFR